MAKKYTITEAARRLRHQPRGANLKALTELQKEG
jgi:hypothetical protein